MNIRHLCCILSVDPQNIKYILYKTLPNHLFQRKENEEEEEEQASASQQD